MRPPARKLKHKSHVIYLVPKPTENRNIFSRSKSYSSFPCAWCNTVSSLCECTRHKNKCFWKGELIDVLIKLSMPVKILISIQMILTYVMYQYNLMMIYIKGEVTIIQAPAKYQLNFVRGSRYAVYCHASAGFGMKTILKIWSKVDENVIT